MGKKATEAEQDTDSNEANTSEAPGMQIPLVQEMDGIVVRNLLAFLADFLNLRADILSVRNSESQKARPIASERRHSGTQVARPLSKPTV